jgi:hypothetical protein
MKELLVTMRIGKGIDERILATMWLGKRDYSLYIYIFFLINGPRGWEKR